MDVIKVEAEEWKGMMDHLASKKETAWAQLASTEAQIRAVREKTEAQSQKIKDLQSQLGSVIPIGIPLPSRSKQPSQWLK